MKRLMSITLVLVSVFLAIGLVASAGQEKTSSEQVASNRDKSSSREIDRMLEDLKLKREDVADLCLENCEKQKSADKVTGGGIINKELAQYPPIASAAHASGEVAVLVVINEEGSVIAAQSVSGHPLLQAAAVKAARKTTFNPYLLDGAPVKVMGTLTYNFVLND